MRRVVITGLGIVSSIGTGADEVAASLREARSGVVHAADYEKMGFRCQVHAPPHKDGQLLEWETLVDRRAARFLAPGTGYAHIAMEQAIADSGRRNYSLFLGPDGLLIGYYETDSVEASQAALAADPRTAAWEAAMADYFVALDGRPDQNSVTLDEIFNLEDQIEKETP